VFLFLTAPVSAQLMIKAAMKLDASLQPPPPPR
jgi:multisubunit Na+/H+ antiporter MnhG subunit